MKYIERDFQNHLHSILTDPQRDLFKYLCKRTGIKGKLKLKDIKIEHPKNAGEGRLDIYIKLENGYVLGIELKLPNNKVDNNQIQLHLKTLNLVTGNKFTRPPNPPKRTKYLIISGGNTIPENVEKIKQKAGLKNCIFWMSWIEIGSVIEKDIKDPIYSTFYKCLESYGITLPNTKFENSKKQIAKELNKWQRFYNRELSDSHNPNNPKVKARSLLDTIENTLFTKYGYKAYNRHNTGAYSFTDNVKGTTIKCWEYLEFTNPKNRRYNFFIGINLLKDGKWYCSLIPNQINKRNIREIKKLIKEKSNKSLKKIDVVWVYENQNTRHTISGLHFSTSNQRTSSYICRTAKHFLN